jgi:hypothetical protein
MALNEEDRQLIIESWRQEALALLDQERSAVANGARAQALALTALAAAGAYGLTGKSGNAAHSLILLGVPPVLALIAVYLQQVFGDAIVMGGTRRELERGLEAALGAPALISGRRAFPLRGDFQWSYLSLPLTQLVYFGALVVTTILIWSDVPLMHHGKELIRHVQAIKTLSVVTTLALLALLLLTALENLWLLPRKIEREITGTLPALRAPAE